MLNVIFASVLPVLCTIALGFAWVRYGRALDANVLTPLLVDIGTPCLSSQLYSRQQYHHKRLSQSRSPHASQSVHLLLLGE